MEFSRPLVLAKPAARTRRRGWNAGWIVPFLYLAPALLLIVIWIYRPLLETFDLSFYVWNLLPTKPKVFAGIDNYIRVLTTPELGIALKNTALYVVGLLPFSVVVPLGLAILVNDIAGRARGVYRVIIFLPVLMAPVVVAVIWRWMLHPTLGILTQPIAALLHVESIDWFREPALALPAIIAITGWKLLGFSFLIFSAGLAGISREYYEAAQLDGAGRWTTVRTITLPLLTPTITFMVMMTVLLASQWVFPIINVLTKGGPLDATTNIYYLLYQFGFRSFDVGWSSAAAVLFFAVFGLLAWLMVRFIDRFSFYES
jgi:multiple sugar transport system permease protein